jgi:hypothetical protein
MEKRSRRRTRDLVTHMASQGLSQNEIGCARISMMARSSIAPFTGRIQMRKTNPPIAHIRLATHGRSIQMGHKPTFPGPKSMSALLLEADMAGVRRHVG